MPGSRVGVIRKSSACSMAIKAMGGERCQPDPLPNGEAMGNRPDRSLVNDHPVKREEPSDQRSDGEQAAYREQVQQEADAEN